MSENDLKRKLPDTGIDSPNPSKKIKTSDKSELLEETVSLISYYTNLILNVEYLTFNNDPIVDEYISKLQREPPDFHQFEDYNLLFSYLVENKIEPLDEIVTYILNSIDSSKLKCSSQLTNDLLSSLIKSIAKYIDNGNDNFLNFRWEVQNIKIFPPNFHKLIRAHRVVCKDVKNILTRLNSLLHLLNTGAGLPSIEDNIKKYNELYSKFTTHLSDMTNAKNNIVKNQKPAFIFINPLSSDTTTKYKDIYTKLYSDIKTEIIPKSCHRDIINDLLKEWFSDINEPIECIPDKFVPCFAFFIDGSKLPLSKLCQNLRDVFGENIHDILVKESLTDPILSEKIKLISNRDTYGIYTQTEYENTDEIYSFTWQVEIDFLLFTDVSSKNNIIRWRKYTKSRSKLLSEINRLLSMIDERQHTPDKLTAQNDKIIRLHDLYTKQYHNYFDKLKSTDRSDIQKSNEANDHNKSTTNTVYKYFSKLPQSPNTNKNTSPTYDSTYIVNDIDNIDEKFFTNLNIDIINHNLSDILKKNGIVQPKNIQTEEGIFKIIDFHDSYKPAYFSIYKKSSNDINGSNPLFKDDKIIDYDADSDIEWESEVEEGENIAENHASEGDDDASSDHLDYSDGFLATEGPENLDPEEAAITTWKNMHAANPSAHKTIIYHSIDKPIPNILYEYRIIPYSEL